jgi:putative hemolysin
VLPNSKNQGANLQNVNGIRASLEHLRAGHPMGFFPSGAMSFYQKQLNAVRDMSWAHSVIRIIQKAKVPVYPVYFDFFNSRFFYWLGKYSWQLRALRTPAEVFNKRGKTLHVYIGKPIPAAEIQKMIDSKDLACLLYQKTYGVKETV